MVQVSPLFKKLLTVASISIFSYANADILVSKKFMPDMATELDTVKVQLTLTNDDALYDATNGKVIDSLPEGMTIAKPVNGTYKNCGSNVSLTTTTNKITASGIKIAEGGKIPCIISFDVVTSKLAKNVSSKNIVNTIEVGDFTATLNGVTLKNQAPASATLLLRSSDVEVDYYYAFINGTTEYRLDGNDKLNAGDDVYLVTQMTNRSPVELTGLGFVDYTGFMRVEVSSSTTTCQNADLEIIKNERGLEQDKITLSGGVLASNDTCKVRLKLLPTEDFKYTYRRKKEFSRYFDAKTIKNKEGVTNKKSALAEVRLSSGAAIETQFCDVVAGKPPNFACGVRKDINGRPSGPVEKYVWLKLTNYNTDGSAFRSSFMDRLPEGMTLADSPDMSSTCPEIKVSGNPGYRVLNIDATKMPPGDKNQTSRSSKVCSVFAKIKISLPQKTTRYHHNLDITKDESDKPITNVGEYIVDIDGGSSKKGFTPLLSTSELEIKIIEKGFRVGKKILPEYKYSGHQSEMTLTLTNTLTDDVTNISIVDNLKEMIFSRFGVEYSPIQFSNGADGTKKVKTTCTTGNPNLGNYANGDQKLVFSDITVPAGQSCTITVPLIANSNTTQLGYKEEELSHSIGKVTYEVNGRTLKTLIQHNKNKQFINRRFFVDVSAKPKKIVAGGSFWLQIRSDIPNGAESDLVDVVINTSLPKGLTLSAKDPQASFTCSHDNIVDSADVKITSAPGSKSLKLEVAKFKKLSLGAGYAFCDLRVLVDTQANYDRGSVDIEDVTINAKEGPGPLSGESVKSYAFSYAQLNLSKTAKLAINKTTSIEEVGLGGIVRSIITLDNSLPDAIDLTDVSLTDDLRISGSSELLVAEQHNAKFVDSAGFRACDGGVFSVDKDRQKITLSKATILAGSKCIFSFDMTALKAGTWKSTIPANTVRNFEGVTNLEATEKSVSFNGNVLIGAKKSVKTLMKNQDGSYTVTYEAGVKNFGAFELGDVELSDNLSDEFGILDTDYSIIKPPTILSVGANSSLNLKKNFSGKGDESIIGTDGRLAVGEEIILEFTMKFTPKTGKGIFDNTMKVSGKSNLGLVTRDASNDVKYVTSGLNPVTNNTPTTVTLTEFIKPQLGVMKSANSVTRNQDDTYTAEYTVKVKNYSQVEIASVSVVDNLATEFTGTNYSISTAPTLQSNNSSTELSLSTNYNGSSQDQLASGKLAIDEEVAITFSITFKPQANKTTYKNQAEAAGVNSLNSALTGMDKSNDKEYEDTSPNSKTNNGDPTDDNVPTPVLTTLIVDLNKKPIAIDDIYTTKSGASITLRPLANDSDPDNDSLTIVSINGVDLTPGTAQVINVTNGIVNVDKNGMMTFKPKDGFTKGQVKFSYVITDGKDTASANEVVNVVSQSTSMPLKVPATGVWSLMLLLISIFTLSLRRA